MKSNDFFFIKVLIFLKCIWFFSSETGVTSVALGILGANGKKAVSAVGLTRGLHEVPFVNSL